ncbi:GDYXXLXY domain-containing protein [Shewanella electrodiphila]|uniref:GDYXXLXY domain-containing protein n=1 Tax=Shewanella electrodiphila TaxID=934143 RepID=A0ABT0KRI0_9GAMM|nr:GDYXXLXY domain-containing protein [Shewanella electrodiphila]MCL1046465.1 GDYXXLXY domain-containing protein [Shewanella electrodiphila]
MPKFSKTAIMTNLNTIILVGTLVLILALVNWQIFQKEQHIRHGELIYLELAPVDPRSLMQGDYMALRFQMSNDIRSALKLRQEELRKEEQVQEERAQEEQIQIEQNLTEAESSANSNDNSSANLSTSSATNEQAETDRQWRKLPNRDGYVVVSVDSRNIATYQALYDGQELAADEMRLQYRVRDGRIKFATNAFFFQEGHASVYEAAKYGEFRVNQQGEVLLTNMFDAELNKLEPLIAAEE